MMPDRKPLPADAGTEPDGHGLSSEERERLRGELDLHGLRCGQSVLRSEGDGTHRIGADSPYAAVQKRPEANLPAQFAGKTSFGSAAGEPLGPAVVPHAMAQPGAWTGSGTPQAPWASTPVVPPEPVPATALLPPAPALAPMPSFVLDTGHERDAAPPVGHLQNAMRTILDRAKRALES
jgi:hypothetical protein